MQLHPENINDEQADDGLHFYDNQLSYTSTPYNKSYKSTKIGGNFENLFRTRVDDDYGHGRGGIDYRGTKAVYSASVTLTARMAPGSGGAYGEDSLLPDATDSRWGGNTAPGGAWWRVTTERLPLIVSVFCGGFLLTLIVLAIVIYRCCVMPRAHKHYCSRKAEDSQSNQNQHHHHHHHHHHQQSLPASQTSRSSGLSHPIYPSHSAVYVDPKNGSWIYNSRLIQNQHGPQWQQGQMNTSSSGNSTNWSRRSISGPSQEGQPYAQHIQSILKRGSVSGSDGRLSIAPDLVYSIQNASRSSGNSISGSSGGQVPRSSSHPGSSGDQPQSLPTYTSTNERRPRPHSQPPGIGTVCDILHPDQDVVHRQIGMMPQISEFSTQQLANSPLSHTVQYASSSILDEVGSRDDDPSASSGVFKTRSLPAWVRSKPRPLSTEDDLAELYAKVNFSKKRKNRMRNDEAAIIALSKSRSQFLHANEKDTDSLVDNEAVIVYDERTAL